MRTRALRISLIGGVLFLGVAAGRVNADVCVTVDETRDTFSPRERTAALLLLARQFELAGERVVPDGCAAPYQVSHVQLGSTITVTLAGPGGRRDATALGIDDVPAVYSQLVRSLLTGRALNARGVVDRTNVSAAQAAPRQRVESDSVVYARLGYGGMFGGQTNGGPSIGVIGYRKELDSFGIDVSFLNFLYKSSNYSYGYADGGLTGSWLKLEALRFHTPLSDRSAYYGGGISWSTAHMDDGSTFSSGSGLQGELTVGYELGRASTIRVFVQADAGLPFYTLTSQTFAYLPRAPFVATTSTNSRWTPSAMLSLGLGWQRGGRK